GREPRLRGGHQLGRRVQAHPEAVRRQPQTENGQRQTQDRSLMTRDELLDLYRRSGALLEGHFRLTSGLHSAGYLQSALVLQYPPHAEALGGVVIGHEVGRALGVRAVFAERQDGVLTLRRGFIIGEQDRVLVVEDVLTTGGSTRETIQVATAAGGQVVGAASIVDRGTPGMARENDLGV